MLRRFIGCAGASLLVVGCGVGVPADPSLEPHSRFLVSMGTVVLEETKSPITDISDLAVRGGLGLAIVDRPGRSVRLHDEEGRLVRILPRGPGPQEIDDPSAIALLPDSVVAVGEAGRPLVKLFGWDGSFRGTIETPDIFAQRLITLNDGALVVGARAVETITFALYDNPRPGSEFSRTFYSWSPQVLDAPYWLSVADDHPVGIGDSVLIVNSLLFDARWFAMSDSGRFSPPPDWWRLPRVPKAYEFSGVGGRRALAGWLAEMKLVRGVAESTGIIAIDVGEYSDSRVDRLTDLFRIETVGWRLIDRGSGATIADIESPGRLAAGGDFFWIVRPASKGVPWRLEKLVPVAKAQTTS